MRSTFMWLAFLCPVIIAGFGSGPVLAGSEVEKATTLDEARDYKVNVSCLLEPVVKLSQQAVIVERVRSYNQSPHRPATELDDIWPTLNRESPPLKAVLENQASELLMQFISLVSMRGEGMLMGMDGGLIAATNHTTDFWQGDEEQFRAVMDRPDNNPIILAAYRDTSTQHFLIKIAAPVLDVEQQKIGVLVIGFDAMVMEFRQLCQHPDATARGVPN